MRRVGVLGYGHIAQAVLRHAREAPDLTVCFVRARTPRDAGVGALPPTVDDLSRTDLVVEAAHPRVVADHGELVLQQADLLVTSSAALIDTHLLARLLKVASDSGTRLILPRGALVGLDAIVAQRSEWDDATITMVKAPSHLDPPPPPMLGPTVLHDGPVAALAQKYPRNVNAMVTFALATVGLDRTRCRLVCDPGTTTARLEMELSGHSGASLHIVKDQPMVGVSGSEMPASIINSIKTLPANLPPGLSFA